MALSINHDEADRLARALVRRNWRDPHPGGGHGVAQRLDRIRRPGRIKRLQAEIDALKKRVAKLPVVDSRAADAIIGYDEHGLPR
jgi:antitoxin VapB